MARLPFVTDPDSRLKPNENEVLEVFLWQVKKLNAKREDKIVFIEGKLQSLGFVD